MAGLGIDAALIAATVSPRAAILASFESSESHAIILARQPRSRAAFQAKTNSLTDVYFARGSVKQDIDYIKRILEAFEACPDPIVNIRWLQQEKGLDHQDAAFVFHLAQLNDLCVIVREDGRPGFGFIRGADWYGSWSIVPLRMTAQGFEFAAVLRNKEILSKLKTEFKDEGIKSLMDLGTKLAKGYAEKKLNSLLGI